MKKIILYGVFFLCFWLLGTLGYFFYWFNTPVSINEKQREFSIRNGQSASSIIKQLHQKKLILWPRAALIYLRYINKATLKAGEYSFSSEESPRTLIDKLINGQVKYYSVTLLEGWTFKEFLAELHAQEKLQKPLHGLSEKSILEQLAIDVESLEGWFFPDTYQYVAGDSDASILQRAHKKMRSVLDQLWAERQENLPYKTVYEALIMASIIEKESGFHAEQAEIAGVFVRRLQKNMRLQTDPTVIYGLGDSYDGNLRRKHLRQPTEYNTYLIKGLPPTPIAMPGTKAIHAALNPAAGDTLYFVAKGDGSHHFSRTLAEHNAAVNLYQKFQRRSEYRSSPPTDTQKNE